MSLGLGELGVLEHPPTCGGGTAAVGEPLPTLPSPSGGLQPCKLSLPPTGGRILCACFGLCRTTSISALSCPAAEAGSPFSLSLFLCFW